MLEVEMEAGGALLYYGARHSREGGDPQIADIIQRWDDFGPTVALYFFLRVYTLEAGGEADESLARDLLAKRTDVEGLRGSLETLDEVDALWSRDYPDQPDWRVVTTEPRVGWLAEISDASRTARGEHMARVLLDLTLFLPNGGDINLATLSFDAGPGKPASVKLPAEDDPNLAAFRNSLLFEQEIFASDAGFSCDVFLYVEGSNAGGDGFDSIFIGNEEDTPSGLGVDFVAWEVFTRPGTTSSQLPPTVLPMFAANVDYELCVEEQRIEGTTFDFDAFCETFALSFFSTM